MTITKACFVALGVLLAVSAYPEEPFAGEAIFNPKLASASDEAELMIKKYMVPNGLKVSLFAAEPMVAHPVALCTDEHGRIFVAETFRFADGINGGGDRDFGALDLRGHMDWLDEDLSHRTVEEREAMLKKNMGAKVKQLTLNSERVQLLEDRDGDGKADHATVFAEGFNKITDGAAAGVLARKGNVWFACAPDLWLLKDTKGTGKADFRKSVHSGFGVRIAFLGHDLHGLKIGPDGKLYFSIGDRGYNVTSDGKTWSHPEMGGVFRCNLDGSDFEVFAYGLRNPESLAFDQYGNLFTADNNADHGDSARWVYIVEAGDSGWRGGYQYITTPNVLGAWNSEKLWGTQFDGQAAYLVPPVADVGVGPSGIAYYPGTGLPAAYNEHFFYCDYRGEPGGIFSFAVKPKGASYELVDQKEFVWHCQATDVVFSVDGGAYFSVWYGGIEKTSKGRVYKVFDPNLAKDSLVLETQKLLAEDLDKRPASELAGLLSHKDQRVRQEAQFSLAGKGAEAIPLFAQVLANKDSQLARLHAIWGLGQVARKLPAALEPLLPLFTDADAEVRAQAAKVSSDLKFAGAYDAMIKLLGDPSPRVQYFAAFGLSKLNKKECVHAIVNLLRANTANDPMIRHSGVSALTAHAETSALLALAKDTSAAVRMGALLAMRRLELPDIAVFLSDADPLLVVEAARAINDVPINAAMPKLAALIEKPDSSEPLSFRVVNANFRLGTPAHAAALAKYATLSEAPAKARIIALQLLSTWAVPSGRDLIVGLWRPLEKRDPKAASAGLAAVINDLLHDNTSSVRLGAIEAAEKLTVKEAAPALFEIVSKTSNQAATRAAALKALAALGDPLLADAVSLAMSDKDPGLRSEGNRLLTQVKPADAAAKLAEILEKSTSPVEMQGALGAIATCKDPKADDAILKWVQKLVAGKAPKEVQLEILEAAAQRNTPAIKEALAQYQAGLPKEDSLAGFRETLFGGNAAVGRKIFFEKVEASCVRCHKVGKDGGDAGPQMSGLGTRQTREYILESILDPNKQIAPGFESLIVKLNNGKNYVGIVKSDTEKEIELNAPPDGIIKIAKADIKMSKRGLSIMPEGLGKILNKQDLRNLVEYLSSLK